MSAVRPNCALDARNRILEQARAAPDGAGGLGARRNLAHTREQGLPS